MPKIAWTKSFNILTFFWPAKTVITIMVITIFWTFTISLVLLWIVYWSAKKVFSATTCNKEYVPCFSDHFRGSCYFQSSPTERPFFHFGTKTTMKICQVAELTPSFNKSVQIKKRLREIMLYPILHKKCCHCQTGFIRECRNYHSLSKVLTNLSNSGHCGGQPKEGWSFPNLFDFLFLFPDPILFFDCGKSFPGFVYE